MVEGEGVRVALRGRDNLFVRAFSSAGADPAGLRFGCKTVMPFYRGLGSSAATISGGVVAGLAWRAGGGPVRGAVGLEGHPDNVAAALSAGSCWRGPGAGRRRSPRGRVPGRLRRAVPEDELPTKLAREALPEAIVHVDAAYTTARAALLVAALERAGRAPGDALDDRLHEPYRAPFVPLLGVVRDRLGGLPAYGATISGAGPSVLVWCERGAAAAVADSLAGIAPRILRLSVAEAGVVVG